VHLKTVRSRLRVTDTQQTHPAVEQQKTFDGQIVRGITQVGNEKSLWWKICAEEPSLEPEMKG